METKTMIAILIGCVFGFGIFGFNSERRQLRHNNEPAIVEVVELETRSEPGPAQVVPAKKKVRVALHVLKDAPCRACDLWKQIEMPKLLRAGVPVDIYEDASRAPVFDLFDGTKYTRQSRVGYIPGKVNTAEQFMKRLNVK